jgi:hypothetical protein
MPLNISGSIASSNIIKSLEYRNITLGGLKLYYDMSIPACYNGTGTTIYDISANGNNGTLVNGPTFSNNAIRLDGVNDYLSLPITGFAPSTHTVEFWIKRHANSGYFLTIDNSDNPELRLQFSAGKVELTWYDDSAYIASFNSVTNITLDIWYHICVTTQNNDFRMYINGVLDTADTSGTYTGAASGNAGEHTLGTYNRPGAGYGGYANVSYGVYRFYNRVLSANEILHNYNIQKTRFEL